MRDGVPVVTPAGGLACHVDAKRFLPHIPQPEYPAGALAAAIYLASGIRSMERGTISTDRDLHGNEVMADLELARLAVPRRVYTMSHIEYAVDRIAWLYQHRDLVGGLQVRRGAAGAALLLRPPRPGGRLAAAPGRSLRGRIRRGVLSRISEPRRHGEHGVNSEYLRVLRVSVVIFGTAIPYPQTPARNLTFSTAW